MILPTISIGRAVLAFVVILAAGTGTLGEESKPLSVRDVARKVDRNYNNLQSLQADFEESYRGAGISRTESGVLWLKRPGKMRWEYRIPREKLFLTNGKEAFFYVPGEQQARKAKLEKIDDLRSPLRYLLGKTKLEKEFDNLQLLSGEGASLVLEGVPKVMRDRVQRVRFDLSPDYRIDRILIEEIDGATTEFRFTRQTENLAMADEKFRFTAPPGVQVLEASEVTP